MGQPCYESLIFYLICKRLVGKEDSGNCCSITQYYFNQILGKYIMVKRLIIGISGASGIIYGVRILQVLKNLNVETHLIVSKSAQLTRVYETSLSKKELQQLADVYYENNNISAAIASGSYYTNGMIIAPCSVKSLSEIANGICDTLITRAADVILKERRRLIIMPRETPLHLGHLQNMVKITKIGGIIFPPVPAFYNKPQIIDDIVNDTVGRVLALLDLDSGLVKQWDGVV